MLFPENDPIPIDKKMAAWVFDRLVAARIALKYPFNLLKAIPPQVWENLPRSITWGSREHALFLFALCYWMRGGIESDTATRALTRLYEMAPNLFLPEHEPQFEPKALESLLGDVGLGFNKAQIARLWKKNLAKLAAEWGSDPRNLFAGIATYEEACERIQNKDGKGFGGFQEKMVSMITYFYMDVTYERTCRTCLIQDTCKFCIPSATYYIGGKLLLRGERDEPPQESLFPLAAR